MKEIIIVEPGPADFEPLSELTYIHMSAALDVYSKIIGSIEKIQEKVENREYKMDNKIPRAFFKKKLHYLMFIANQIQ